MLNVVLFEPEIPPNTGTIGRLCHSTDTSLHLIEPLGFSIDDRSLKRAGLDYWHELKPSLWSSLEDCLAAASEEAAVYYLTTKTEQAYWEAKFKQGDYLVFGPETRGLPESLLKTRPESCLTIPQTKGRSLNLAVATGIVLYEAIRQISIKP
jgi:tRNA (cytidine/uridine-2'-O-)-methyltransferase